MTERSLFWETNDVGDGPASGYSQQRLYEWLAKLVTPTDAAAEGVLRNVDNELAVTGTATPLTVAEGAAQVYGFFYENTAPVEKAVSTPVVGTTGGRVVLQADWTAQTVRIVVNMSADGVAAIPALTQSAGTTWEISLATFTITTGGVITVTDARSYARFATRVKTDMIEDAAVTTAKLGENAVANANLRDSAAYSVIGRSAATGGDPADIAAGADEYVLRRRSGALGFGQVFEGGIANNAVTADKIASGAVNSSEIASSAVTTDKIANLNVTTGKLAAEAVTDAKIADGNVTNPKLATGAVSALKLATDAVSNVKIQDGAVSSAKIATNAVTGSELANNAVSTSHIQNNAVDDTKAGDRVPQFIRREGGSSSAWNVRGTNNYTPGAVRMQAGVTGQISLGPGDAVDSIDVTFPVAFSNVPIVIVSPLDLIASGSHEGVLFATNETASGFRVTFTRDTTTQVIAMDVSWLAIGPE